MVVTGGGLLDVLLALLVAGLLALGLLALRRQLLNRRGGTFDCSLRLHDAGHGKGWVLGVGRYAGDVLEWYRVFSYSPRPRRSFTRQGLAMVESRRPTGVEVFSLLSGALIARCQYRGGSEPAGSSIELGMSEDSLTGFRSWLESAPPVQPGP